MELKTIPIEAYSHSFYSLYDRSNACTALEGDYIEKIK